MNLDVAEALLPVIQTLSNYYDVTNEVKGINEARGVVYFRKHFVHLVIHENIYWSPDRIYLAFYQAGLCFSYMQDSNPGWILSLIVRGHVDVKTHSLLMEYRQLDTDDKITFVKLDYIEFTNLLHELVVLIPFFKGGPTKTNTISHNNRVNDEF